MTKKPQEPQNPPAPDRYKSSEFDRLKERIYKGDFDQQYVYASGGLTTFARPRILMQDEVNSLNLWGEQYAPYLIGCPMVVFEGSPNRDLVALMFDPDGNLDRIYTTTSNNAPKPELHPDDLSYAVEPVEPTEFDLAIPPCNFSRTR